MAEMYHNSCKTTAKLKLIMKMKPYKAQQAKKQKAERLANAELRNEGTQIDPHGLRRKPKMPKIINLGNCVKLLWFITFHKKVVNLITFLRS